MSLTYSFAEVGSADHHTQARRLEVGGFTVAFEKEIHYVIARIGSGKGIEIPIPNTEPKNGDSFWLSRPSAIALCSRSDKGTFSEEYFKGDSMEKHMTQLFNRLIKKEAGGQKSYESRILVLREPPY